MRSLTIPACIALLAAFSGCTPKPIAAEPPVQRERTAYLERTADTPIACTAGTDCDEKWKRALAWVSQHSVYSIKTSTGSEISTNGPIEPTTDSAFTITKSQEGANSYAIHFSSTCGQQVTQTTAGHCIPTGLELRSQFNNFLLYGTEHGNY